MNREQSGSVSVKRSLGVVGGSRIAIQTIQLIVFIVLTHWVAPHEFGVYALCVSAFSLAVLVSNATLQSATMLHGEGDLAVQRTAFTANVLIVGVASAVIWFFAEYVQLQLELEGLASALRVTCGAILISIAVVPLVELERAQRFGWVAVAEVHGQVVAGISSVVLEFAGYGATGLATGLFLGSSVTTLVLFCAHGGPVGFGLGRAPLSRIKRHASGMLGFGVGNYLVRNVDNFSLAGRSTALELGLYSRAYMLALMPVLLLGAVINRVLYPKLVSQRLESHFVQAATWRAVAQLPLSVGFAALAFLAVLSADLVAVLFGTAWGGLSLPLAILTLAGVPQLMGSSVGCVFQSLDRAADLFWLVLLQFLLVGTGAVVGSGYGAVGAAVGVTVGSWMYIPGLMYRLSRVSSEICVALVHESVAALSWGVALCVAFAGIVLLTPRSVLALLLSSIVLLAFVATRLFLSPKGS